MAWHHRACWTEHGRCSGCGAVQAAGATTTAPRPPAARPRTLAPRQPGNPHPAGAWFLFSVGASNVLFFGGLSAWDLAGSGQDMAALGVIFVPLGLWLSIWSGHMLWRSRADPEADPRRAKGAGA